LAAWALAIKLTRNRDAAGERRLKPTLRNAGR